MDKDGMRVVVADGTIWSDVVIFDDLGSGVYRWTTDPIRAGPTPLLFLFLARFSPPTDGFATEAPVGADLKSGKLAPSEHAS